ncbi:MAG: type III-B CRISPR module-associated protein Cmr5 [Methylococcales bacterium]
MATLPLDLLRAKHALRKIDKLKADALEGKGYGNYVSYVERLPAAILQNGLGQALATLLAGAKLAEPPKKRNDDEKARERLYQQIQDWLCRDHEEAPYRGQLDLMHAIVSGDEDSYLHAQAEVLAYIRWLKKFAAAFLKKMENG